MRLRVEGYGVGDGAGTVRVLCIAPPGPLVRNCVDFVFVAAGCVVVAVDPCSLQAAKNAIATKLPSNSHMNFLFGFIVPFDLKCCRMSSFVRRRFALRDALALNYKNVTNRWSKTHRYNGAVQNDNAPSDREDK